jgi:hypothetical protein
MVGSNSDSRLEMRRVSLVPISSRFSPPWSPMARGRVVALEEVLVESAARSVLNAWESFYVIVGSSAAALTGLQFVVMALIAETRTPGAAGAVAAFGTPTVVHFSAVLLVSAIMSAPWSWLPGAAMALGACGVAGLVYTALAARRARQQTEYQPVFEDWLCHVALPFLAYAGALATAVMLPHDPRPALFVLGTAALLLLFVGIHNSWDSVTFIVIDRRGSTEREKT